jgi:hypothetical protein
MYIDGVFRRTRLFYLLPIMKEIKTTQNETYYINYGVYGHIENNGSIIFLLNAIKMTVGIFFVSRKHEKLYLFVSNLCKEPRNMHSQAVSQARNSLSLLFQNVWGNLARMCVKSQRLDVAQVSML